MTDQATEPTYLEPGAYSNVPADDYHGDKLTPEPALSSSGAKRLMKDCPAVFWHERNTPPEPSTALKIGSAAHEWLLEGEGWPSRHYVTPPGYDSRKTKQMAAEIAEAKAAEEAGKRVIKAEEFEQIKRMHDELVAHEFVMNAFSGGMAEQTLIWRDEQFGIWCRARLDYIRPDLNMITDYKSAIDVAPDALQRAIYNFGYHQQAAWYVEGAQALGILDNPSFLFAFQRKEPPHLVVPCILSADALAWGHTINQRAKYIFAKCLRENRWPGYTDDVLTIDLPAFAMKQLNDRAARGEFHTGEAA